MANDFLQNDGEDLIFNNNGDFAIGDSEKQHISDIIYTAPGWYKEFPSVGVNIQQYLSGAGISDDLNRNLKLQLQSDGYSVTTAKFIQNGENLILDTNATRI
jgi:hypothetical protein